MSTNTIETNVGFKVEMYDKSKPLSLIEIPVSANAWITEQTSDCCTEVISKKGLCNWTSDQTIISVNFHIKNSIKADFFVKCKVPNGKSKIQISFGDCSQVIEVEKDYYQLVRIGKFKVFGSGYVRLEMKGIEKTGKIFAEVSHLVLALQSVDECITFIRESNPDNTYWGRRGPSVHLAYILADNKSNSEYYYNEMTVPFGYDPIGSYFMAIGFDVGYFGLQVNSATERRVLFSVWSPQDTDDPNHLVDENKVKLVAKSEDVVNKVFGNEGCGQQSILKYNWSADTTYKFLIRGRPDPNESNHSVYTAWFAKLDTDWKMIASFKRPKTHKYLSQFHSFVENFDPNTGCETRRARFGNQWIGRSCGNWHEVTRAKLTGDSTAQNKVRLDFNGGVETVGDNCQEFYLQNCGFFVSNTRLLSEFTRFENKVKPKIDFEKI